MVLTRLQKMELALALALFLSGIGVAQEDVPAPGPDDGEPPDGGPDGGGGPAAPFEGDNELCSVYGADAVYVEMLITGDTNDESYRNITASGCPNHWNSCQKPYCTEQFQAEAAIFDLNPQIPSYPRFKPDGDTTDVNCLPGQLAVALNGVGIFGQTDGTNECGDAIAGEATTFDVCGAHAEPSGGYHYHTVPQCLLAQLGEVDTEHSPQFGWSFDGFPLYGPFGPEGVMMYPCTNENADETYCLDECNGYRGALPDVDEFLYRYYSSGTRGDMACAATVENSARTICDFDADSDNSEVEPCCTSAVPSTDFWPYIIGCYVGCTVNELADGSCDGGEVGYTFTDIPMVDGITELFELDGFDYSGLEEEDTEDDDEDEETSISPAVTVMPHCVVLSAVGLLVAGSS